MPSQAQSGFADIVVTARRREERIQDVPVAVTATQGGFGGDEPRFLRQCHHRRAAYGTNAGFFDLASVEVLQGPQGTLFGHNTTGGAVVITPRTATDKFEEYVRGTFGNYDTKIVEGAVNVPLAEGLALRLVDRVADHRGIPTTPAADRYFDDEKNTSWRATLRWVPNKMFTNTLVANSYHAKNKAMAGV